MREPDCYVSAYISSEMLAALRTVSQRHNISISSWIKLCLVDALYDEGFHDLQCSRTTRRQEKRERVAAAGGAAP
jgi:hypothetical protein